MWKIEQIFYLQINTFILSFDCQLRHVRNCKSKCYKKKNIFKNTPFFLNTSCWIFSKNLSLIAEQIIEVESVWLSMMLSIGSFSIVRIIILSELIVRSIRTIFRDLRLKICWEFNRRCSRTNPREKKSESSPVEILRPFLLFSRAKSAPVQK